MRHIFWLLGVFALLALTACPPTYPKCSSDDQCKEHNEVCVQGQCQECVNDSNCKTGFVCQQNKCAPKPECTPEKGCGPGKGCEAGKCVTHECEKDGDCKDGATCQEHSCVKAPGTCNRNDDCPGGQECQAGKCATAKADKCDWAPVHFGFNEHTLSREAQTQLSNLVDCIKAAKGKIRLEGHADERGTEEYNLQLSNRRAASVRKYLVDLGVPQKGLETVGYGANRPANPGHNEEAWAQNRRVELVK